MSHLALAPVALPLLLGVLLVALGRAPLVLQRTLSFTGVVLLVVIGAALVSEASSGTITVYRLGDWQPPFGIALVVDRLSAVLVLLTACVALPALLYASAGEDGEGRYFHALFQLQLMGINGAFLTGDLFNLFVFFEVLLIASYGLLLHGGAGTRPGAALHVVALNLVGSALFLFAVGAIYSVTGTLNLADLSRIVPQLDAADAGLARAGGLLLLVVFGLKAALLPLLFWLPRAYAAAPASVVALFAVLTKVGAYAILRVFTQVYGPAAGEAAQLGAPWVLPLGLATLGFGAVSALAARDLLRLGAALVIASMGQLLAIIGLFTESGRTAALYYLVQSTLAGSALFLLIDLLRRQRVQLGALLQGGEVLRQPLLLGLAFMTVGFAYIGLPPSSGFLGKLLALEAAWPDPRRAAFWIVTLASGAVMLVALARSGSQLFWKTGTQPAGGEAAAPRQLLAVALPATASLLLMLLAQPVLRYAAEASSQLADIMVYQSAVLGDTQAVDARRRSFP